MIDASTLEYEFDEEAIGFGEPAKVVEPSGADSLSVAQKGALAMVGIGVLALIVQIGGAAGAGTWTGMFLSLGLILCGGAISFRLKLAGTLPGIKHDGIQFSSLLARGALGWITGIVMTGLYVLIYWYPEILGDHGDDSPTGVVRIVDPLARVLTGYAASRWFLYGVLYTGAILVFGVRMLMKYRHNRYHRLRTMSVMVSQLFLAWLLPNLLVYFRQPYLEFNGVWPLKQDYLWPSKIVDSFGGAGLMGALLLTWAAGLVIATPILTYFFGKRWYCSWICGCGGLAETLGDPFRQLSSKSTKAWKLERWLIHSVLVTVMLVTVMLWANHLTGGKVFGSSAGTVKQWYGFYIGAVFAGVVGVGFYPILGNRVWCRFGCPQAAILGLWQRIFSRFRITTNGGQCMSCGNCSTYCEMGIDVRAYAQRSENIVRASCVGCGVCAAVCPRGVLRLENGLAGDRFEGSDLPLKALVASFQEPDIYGYEAWPPPEGASEGASKGD